MTQVGANFFYRAPEEQYAVSADNIAMQGQLAMMEQ